MSEPNLCDDDARLRALLAWRQELVAAGVVAASTFKVAHMRLVHPSGCTDVEQIRAMLPGVVAERAEEIARVLAAIDGSNGEPPPWPGDGHASAPGPFAPFTFGEQDGTP